MSNGGGSGFKFEVHRTAERALAFLERWPVAFLDSQWLEAHLPLLRADPAGALALFDRVAAKMQSELESSKAFPADGGPVFCSVWGVPMTGGKNPADFVRRRRELLANTLASPSLGIRVQMDSFEMDIQKHR